MFTVASVPFLLSDCFALPLSVRRGLVDHVFFFCGSFPDVFPGQWFAMFTVATVPCLLSDFFLLNLSLFVEDWQIVSSFAGAFLTYSLDSDLQYSQLQPFPFFCRIFFASPLSFRRGLVDQVFFFCGSFPDVFPGQWFAIFTVATVPSRLSDFFVLPLSFRRRLVDCRTFFALPLSLFVEDW